MASYANISADQGATFQTILEVEDSFGDPLDLSDYNLHGQIRRTYKSSVAQNFTITTPNPSNGVLYIELSDQETGAMKSGRYVYDVYGINSTTNKSVKLLEGIFELIPSVTKV